MGKQHKKTTPSKYVQYFDGQFDDEEVMYVFRRHPVVMRKGLIFGSLGLLAGPLITLIMTYTNSENPPTMNFFYLSVLGSLALSAILFFPFWMGWYFSMFIVTNQRFIQISQRGFFHRNVSDIGLNLIQSINYEIDGVEATFLGYGTIIMQTYVGDVHMHHMHHPAKVQRTIVDIMRGLGITPNTDNIKNMRVQA